MAQFGPQESQLNDQTVSPAEYNRWFTPIETPTYPSSKAKAAEGTKEAFESLNEVNKGVKEYAENVGYEAGQKIQSDMGASVQALYENTFPGKSDTLVATPDNTPQPVKDGISQAQNIRAARDQGGLPGHIRETEYYKQLYMKASELRARWPGYRDQIDKGFERATGITPNANQYIKSMLADLNEAAGKKDADRTKAISEMYSFRGAQGWEEHLGALIDNKPGALNDAIGWMGRNSVLQWQSKNAKENMEVGQYDQFTGERRARSYINDFVGRQSSEILTGMKKKFNLDDAAMQQMAENPDSVDPKKADAMIAHLTLAENKLDESINTWASVPPGSMGPKEYLKNEYQKTVDEAKAPLKAWKEAIGGKDWNLLNRYHHLAKAYEDKDYYHLFKVDNQSTLALRRAAIAKRAGAGVINPITVVPDEEELNQVLGGAASKTLPSEIKNMDDAVKLIDKENAASPNRGLSLYSFVNKVGSAVSSNSQLTDAEKANLLEFTFKQGDPNWLVNIATRGIDKLSGQDTYGKEDVYKQFAAPEFRDQVKKIAGTTNSKVYEHYQNWIDNNFYALTKQTLNELPELGKVTGLAMKFHPEDKPPRLSWEFGNDVNTPRTFTSFLNPTPRIIPGTRRVGDISLEQATLESQFKKLNDALASLHNTRADQTSALFLKSLYNAGLNPATAPTSAAASIFNAMEASKKPKEGSTKIQERRIRSQQETM